MLTKNGTKRNPPDDTIRDYDSHDDVGKSGEHNYRDYQDNYGNANDAPAADKKH